MSAEVKTSSGEWVQWRGDFSRRKGNIIEAISIGEYTFHRTDMYIGALRFLAGDKDFEIESVRVQIPDNTNGMVKFGQIEFPYEQFVGGVCWLLTQSGRFSQEFQPVRDVALSLAIEALERELKVQVPRSNRELLALAQDLENEHRSTDGLYGMSGSMVFAYRY